MIIIEWFEFPRCVVNRAGSILLLCFGDASESALAAVVYFRAEIEGEVVCTLAAARGKAAPVNWTSVPKLELTAAVMTVRLAELVRKAVTVHIQETLYFTDSSSVLGQVRSDTAVPHAFEAVRVSEIQHKTSRE